MTIKAFIPWWAKIPAKLLLSRLPINYHFWKGLSLFDHGEMDQPEYAYQVFQQHFERFQQHRLQMSLSKPEQNSAKGFVSLEMGPGDSIFSAVISRAFGSEASYLVDVGKFATIDIKKYQTMANFLEQKGLPTTNLENVQSFEELLNCCNAYYLTNGLSSLRTIPPQSIDFIFSHGVLELIRRSEFFDTLKELRRIIRPNGICSHLIPLTSSLGDLNNLRFKESIWESDFMANSGFYTNRIQYFQMLKVFQQSGFEVEVIKVNYWDKLPTPKSKLDKEFRAMSDEELSVLNFSVILKPV